MSRIELPILGAFAFGLSLIGGAAAQDAANTVYDVSISSDGKSYAVLRQLNDQQIVAVYDADDAEKAPVAVGLGDLPVSAFAWGGNDHILVRVSADRTGVRTTSGLQTVTTSRWMSIEESTGEMETLFGDEVGNDYNYYIGSAGELISTLPEKPGHALFSRVKVSIRPAAGPTRMQSGDDKLVYALQEVNLANGGEKVIETGNEITSDWVVTGEGETVARIDEKAGGGLLVFTRADGKGPLREAADIDYDDGPYTHVEFYGEAETPGAIQALVTRDDGSSAIVEFDLASGAFGDAIFTPANGSVDAVKVDHGRGYALAAVGGGVVRHLRAADRALASSLEKAVPGSTMLILSKSASGDRIIVKAFAGAGAEEFYFYDAPGRRLELIARNG